MLGLSAYAECGDARFLSRPPGYGPPAARTSSGAPPPPHHPYSGMLYSEFQYRPPPPSYQASMQEYRLRLLLDRNAPPPPPPPAAAGALLSPPPAYRGPPRSGGLLAPIHYHGSDVSRPPSYRSRASDHHHHHLAILHGRHPSQLSYLSQVLTEEGEEIPKGGGGSSLDLQEPLEQQQHASVVPVIPAGPQLIHKASIRIGDASEKHYITNLQEQFQHDEALIAAAEGKKKSTGRPGHSLSASDRVTIVQNNPAVGCYQVPPSGGRPASGHGNSGGVIVTVSALCEGVAAQQASPEVDILAHL